MSRNISDRGAESLLLELENAAYLPGPNVWMHCPACVCIVVQGSIPNRASKSLVQLYERLEQHLETLLPHGQTSDGRASLQERLNSRAELPQIVEMVAVALYAATGNEMKLSCSRPTGENGRWVVALEAAEGRATLECVKEAIAIVQTCWSRGTDDLEMSVARIRSSIQDLTPDPLCAAVRRAAKERGIPVLRWGTENQLQIATGRHARRISGAIGDFTSAAALEFAKDEYAVRRMLMNAGIPTPMTVSVRAREHAPAVVGKLGYPVEMVIHSSETGDRVQFCRDATALNCAWPEASEHECRVVLRQWTPYPEYLVLVLEGVLTAIVRDARDASAACSEADSVCRLADVHAEVRQTCELAASLIGLPIVVLRIRTPDLSCSFASSGGVVFGLDLTGDFQPFEYAADAPVEGVANYILDRLFPPGSASRIPIVAVTGTNGKTTTTRLISHLLRTRYATVGAKTTDGVTIGDRLVIRGDTVSAAAASLMLSSTEVDIAVLETAHGGILNHGLGFDAADIGVVLNISSDHLSDCGIVRSIDDLVWIKGLVAESARSDGYVVLNADDERVAAMHKRASARCVYFSALPRSGHRILNQHLGISVSVEYGDIVVNDGRACAKIASLAEVPICMNGLATVQYSNVLAAVAVAHVQRLDARSIRAGLLSFDSSPEMNPGRMNLLRTKDAWVLVDFAHNVASIEGIVRFSRALGVSRRLAVIGLPADRRDDDIRACAGLLAGFDHVIVRERDSPGPRPPGTMVALLEAGLREQGMPPDRISAFISERDAVRALLNLQRPGDLLVILAWDVDMVLEQVRR